MRQATVLSVQKPGLLVPTSSSSGANIPISRKLKIKVPKLPCQINVITKKNENGVWAQWQCVLNSTGLTYQRPTVTSIDPLHLVPHSDLVGTADWVSNTGLLGYFKPPYLVHRSVNNTFGVQCNQLVTLINSKKTIPFRLPPLLTTLLLCRFKKETPFHLSRLIVLFQLVIIVLIAIVNIDVTNY